MEIADHAGETNGPEPVEETGARQGRGKRTRERKLTKEGGRERERKQREETREKSKKDEGEGVVSRRQSPSTVAGVPTRGDVDDT